MDAVILGGKTLPIIKSRGAAIDTGTSLIAMPTEEAEALNAAIGATKSWNGQYTVPCNTVSDLPTLTLVFGGKNYTLEGTDYILNLGGEGSDSSCSILD